MMSAWKNLKIGKKLASGFGVSVVVLLLLGLVAWYELRTINAHADNAMQADYLAKQALTARKHEKDFMLRKDVKYLAEGEKVVRESHSYCEVLKADLDSQSSRELVDGVGREFDNWLAALRQYVNLESQKDLVEKQVADSSHVAIQKIEELEADQQTKFGKELKTLTSGDSTQINDRFAKVVESSRLGKLILEARRREKDFILRGDEKYRTMQGEHVAQLISTVRGMMPRFKDTLNTKRAEDIVAGVTDYQKCFEQYVALAVKQKTEGEAMVATAHKVQTNAEALRQAEEANMNAALAQAQILVCTLALVGLVVSVTMDLWISKSITQPIVRTMNVLEAMAAGDCSQRIDMDSKDEIGRMVKALNTTVDANAKLLHDVKDAAAREQAVQQQRAETDRRAAEETGRALEKAQQSADNLDNLPSPVVTVDRSFTVTYINPVGARVIGSTPQQCLGRKCYDLFKTPHCRTPECRCARAMERDGVFTAETVADPSGLNLPIQYTGAPIKTADGRIVGALEYIVDLTAMKKAEQERADAERRQAETDQKRREQEAAREREARDAEQRRKEEQAVLEAQQAEVERRKADQLRGKVDRLLQVVGAAAQGDLTQKVEVQGNEAIDELAAGIGKMLADLCGIIGQVTESSVQFTEGSRVIADSAQTLAQGAQTQSSTVQQMSASIEELARSIDAVKTSAIDADKVAKETNRLAEDGGAAVQKSVEAMELIRTSSEQISEIIQVISEIASQTNLLALNAAIEAARAGEHGLGFAVVADEVRKLAERSNQAAGEISKLIKESTQRVYEGATLSEQTGEALKRIIQGVEATAGKISEIATATVQQAANAQEVSGAIQNVSHVTEQAAAGSEEMASSSEELGAQSAALRDLVSRFKTDDSGSRNTGRAPKALAV
ncbi:MAG: methyl-accepting chemotaxis protein [Pirellulales bacterium]